MDTNVAVNINVHGTEFPVERFDRQAESGVKFVTVKIGNAMVFLDDVETAEALIFALREATAWLRPEMEEAA